MAGPLSPLPPPLNGPAIEEIFYFVGKALLNYPFFIGAVTTTQIYFEFDKGPLRVEIWKFWEKFKVEVGADTILKEFRIL